MKKSLFLLLLLAVALRSFTQPSITNLSFPSSVNLFDKYEISFELGPYGNPYDPDTISVYAIFTAPDNTRDSVLGFFYKDYNFLFVNGHEVAFSFFQDGSWKIRFTPDAVGTWSFRIHAIDVNGTTVTPALNSQPYSFTCLAVANAKGFVSKANNRYLKRDVVERSQRRFRSFFPVGPNIAWYFSNGVHWNEPIGIYDYTRRIDSLHGNANYTRIILNRYQSLNLYGPEYTQIVNGDTTVYFDSTLNLKDAAELDRIVEHAAQNDTSIMLCLFSHSDFKYSHDDHSDPSIWRNNPYHTILNLEYPCNIFSNSRAQRVAKNLIRYIVSRWGYATNIMSWELWNEVTQIPDSCTCYEDSIFIWHKIMSDYVREIDPFHHCVSTSMSKEDDYPTLYANLFNQFDFVQRHSYQRIHTAKSDKQMSYMLYYYSGQAHDINNYPDKPFFMGEFGLTPGKSNKTKDPFGIDLHNDLWSSLFSASMGPGSFWWWSYVDSAFLYNRFKPILAFCQGLPILSDSFEAFTTGDISGHALVFDNNIETYYIKNTAEDTIYGWCQDTAFCYQSLRWLTDTAYQYTDSLGFHRYFVDSVVLDPSGYVYTLDPLKKPGPSSNSNIIEIPITSQPVGTTYKCYWYNSETGGKLANSLESYIIQTVLVLQHSDGTKYININFPSEIRDLANHTINNTFGDAVFRIILSNNNNSEN